MRSSPINNGAEPDARALYRLERRTALESRPGEAARRRRRGPRADWLADAGAVEAFREQWRVEPDRLGQEDSLRGLQAIEWEDIRAQLESDPSSSWTG